MTLATTLQDDIDMRSLLISSSTWRLIPHPLLSVCVSVQGLRTSGGEVVPHIAPSFLLPVLSALLRAARTVAVCSFAEACAVVINNAVVERCDCRRR